MNSRKKIEYCEWCNNGKQTNICSYCGANLCEKCTVETAFGENYCKSCVLSAVKSDQACD
jgi:hypothetical protein